MSTSNFYTNFDLPKCLVFFYYHPILQLVITAFVKSNAIISVMLIVIIIIIMLVLSLKVNIKIYTPQQ